MSVRFAAFIITYERSDILPSTVSAIFNQTFPPSKVLIVDNSVSNKTELWARGIQDSRVEYIRVGFNSGPAGAARIGLNRLAKAGYQWIHWADDDNPPIFTDSFEIIMKHANESIGILGAVGSVFDWKTGMRKRYKDHELTGLLPVDAIGGGYCMIVNAKVLNAETLPDDRLFFGLEEFDFCQRVKRAGFSVYIVGELLFRYREANQKLGLNKTPSLISKRSINHLHREYYSYRNAIFLMSNTFHRNDLAIRYVIRAVGKMLFGFLKGIKFGTKNFKLLYRAIIHGLTGKMGKGL